ncbi:hypothetical protein OIU79_011521 [Salix purpurea]|uniref:Uncharacterized protein n=1 Tax=Salix purpurea TaxID=77065 RepID=A0A9Q0Q1B3_SALPP|nr:hypothetical protein OIU79_011521 [Salix purpurea]
MSLVALSTIEFTISVLFYFSKFNQQINQVLKFFHRTPISGEIALNSGS